MGKTQVIAEALELSLEAASQVWGEIASERCQEMKADMFVVVEHDKVLHKVKSQKESFVGPVPRAWPSTSQRK